MKVVSIIVDVDTELRGVADDAEVEVCEMKGRALSVVVGPQVEVEGVLLHVDREEFGAEIRYVCKARKLVVCVDVSFVVVRRVMIDAIAQLSWEVADAEMHGHCGGGSLCDCGKTAGSGGSQCSGGGESSVAF
jgi:hypothetical protein